MRKFILCLLASLTVILAAILGKATHAPAQAAALTTTSPETGARTALGPAIALAHGIVQVQVTSMGSRILEIQAIQLPHDNNHSWLDSQNAATTLRSEILTTQNTHPHTITGATYTSTAYLQSLNAALDLAAPPAPKMSPAPLG